MESQETFALANMKRKYSNESLETSSENILTLHRTPSGINNTGLSSSKVINENCDHLTEYELTEIRSFKAVYFTGKKGVCKFNGRFSSKKGLYRGLTGDHIYYRYEILKVLGRGSYGLVFKCWDHKKSELVAVKIIKCKEKYRKAGELESSILDKLGEHEHNVFVEKKKSFEFREHFCIVFELLHCTLFNFLQEHPEGINLIVVKRIAVQLLQGLKQIHSMRYVHCDLKPDNIMLQYESKSKIKIIDLGSACFTFNKAIPRYIQTRYYRAPEVILGVNYDFCIDYWSLGCVLVELITGETLFMANDEGHLVKLIVGLIGEPSLEFLNKARKASLYFDGSQLKDSQNMLYRRLEDILGRISGTCLDFIKKCLVWDPKDRMNYEIGLNHPWIKGRK